MTALFFIYASMFQKLTESALVEDLERKKDSPTDRALTVFADMISEKLEEEMWDRLD